MDTHPAVVLILIGLALAAIGLAWWLLPNLPWFGRLPGDIRWEGEHGRFYFPVVTCLALSLVLSLVVWLVQRFWR